MGKAAVGHAHEVGLGLGAEVGTVVHGGGGIWRWRGRGHRWYRGRRDLHVAAWRCSRRGAVQCSASNARLGPAGVRVFQCRAAQHRALGHALGHGLHQAAAAPTAPTPTPTAARRDTDSHTASVGLPCHRIVANQMPPLLRRCCSPQPVACRPVARPPALTSLTRARMHRADYSSPQRILSASSVRLSR